MGRMTAKTAFAAMALLVASPALAETGGVSGTAVIEQDSVAKETLSDTPASDTAVPAAQTAHSECFLKSRFPADGPDTGVEWDDLDSEVLIPLCEQWIAEHPEDRDARSSLGRLYYKAKRYEDSIATLQPLADAGYPRAMVNLGNILRQDNARNYADEPLQDEKTAFALYERAADAGYPWGLERLADAYRNGWGVARDPAKALEIDRQAVAAGAVRSMENIATALVDEGFQSEPKPAEAIEWLERAGTAGVDSAYNILAAWFRDGKIVERDTERAERYFEQGIAAGNSYSPRGLASLLLDTKNGRSDPDRAIALLEKAGEGGETLAWNDLGLAFKKGEGVARDYSRAEGYFEKAIAGGDEYAPGNLADLLFDPDRDPAPDTERALDILEQAAQGGNAVANERLAGYYYDGRYVTRDYVKSREYYEAAARGERNNANRMLGFIYLYGRGVPKDKERGFAHMETAAKGGLVDAKYSLAGLHEIGDGTPKDLDQAEQWFRQAAFDFPKAFGEDYVAFLVRNERTADAEDVADILTRAANLGNGTALAALAWPSVGLQKLGLSVDPQVWREKLENIDEKALFDTATNAFYIGNLVEKKSKYVYQLIQDNPHLPLGKRLTAERNFLIDHGLYGLLFDRVISISQMPDAERKAQEIPTDWFGEFTRIMDFGSRWKSSDSPQNVARFETLSELGARGAMLRLYERALDPRDPLYDLDRAFELAAMLEGENAAADLVRKARLLYRRDRSDPAIGTVIQQAMTEELRYGQSAEIAYRLMHGRWSEPDYEAAAKLLEDGLENKDKLARLMMAELLWEGEGVEQDRARSLKLLMELATDGFGMAMARLGDHYAAGAGVVKDEALALKLYRYADDVNYYEFGPVRLARAAVLGIGMSADAGKATRWLETADRRGDPDAASWLERCAPAPTLACYRVIPALGQLPFAPEPVFAIASLEERIAKIEAEKAALTLGEFRGDRYTDYNTRLISSYRVTSNAERLHDTMMDRVRYQGSEWLKKEGSTDSFFYNRTMACYWGKAAKNMRYVGRKDEALLYAKLAVNHLQTARRKLEGLETAFQDCFLDANGDRYRYLADMLVEQGRLGEAENVLAMLKDYEHTEYVRGPVDGDTSKQNMELSDTEAAAWEVYAATLNALRDGSITQEEAKRQFAEANGKFRKNLMALREQAAQADADALAEGEDSNREDATRRINVALMRHMRGFDDRTAALHAVVMPDKLHWIVTTAQYQQSITVDVSQTELRAVIANAREAIIYEAEMTSEQALQQVYKRLFAPVDKVLTSLGTDRLLVSLDGALRYLPLSALHDGTGHLVRRYAVNIIRDRSDIVRAEDDRPDQKIAAFGMSKPAAGFKALAGVPVELRSIVQSDIGDGFLPGTIRLDEEFDRNSLVSALDEEYPVIHLASHFTLAPTSPQKSVLLLGDGNTVSLSDLTLDGEFNFFHAKLLTLSACQTALSGQRADGREVDSLAALAQDAGVPAVLASLWSVSDASTAKMMREFYKVWLEQGKDKARAMQAAKLTLLDDPSGKFAEPFFWSAFIVLGDGR
jgi:CHAT domain-containing protein/TPR repeat protein